MRLTKEQNKAWDEYFLSHLITCPEDYDLPGNMTDQEKLQAVLDSFRSEYGHEIKRKGEWEAFASWLQGLPSYVDIPFYNADILTISEKMGSISPDASEKEQWKIIESWFSFCTSRIMRLKKKYKID